VIRIAVAAGIGTVIALTVLFIVALDAPAVPLLPIALLVVLTDLGFLVIFTRQRTRALRELDRREVGLPPAADPVER
jgi:hypothetical protein